MPSAVGIRAAGEGNVIAAGTFSGATRKPVQQGSTVEESYTQGLQANDLNAATQLQGGTTYNPFQEVNLFVAELSVRLGVGPAAAIRRLEEILAAMKQQIWT